MLSWLWFELIFVKEPTKSCWYNIFHVQFFYLNKQDITQSHPWIFAIRLKAILMCYLTLLWGGSLSYIYQFTDLQSKSIDWFLYDRDLRHERVTFTCTFDQKANLSLSHGAVHKLQENKFLNYRKNVYTKCYRWILIYCNGNLCDTEILKKSKNCILIKLCGIVLL